MPPVSRSWEKRDKERKGSYDEIPFCRCKEHREATKQMSLWRLPEILTIQLKRFSFRNLLWRDKIDQKVHFPVE